MKKIGTNKLFFIALVCIFGFKLQDVIAAQTFQNNLVKADLYKSSLGGVKLTLYTNAPYNEKVFVNKKNDNEYVILMPETSNSLTAKPSLSSVDDVVKSVDVKTQQYNNQLKGYTKITITTVKPVEIMPQVQALSPTAYKVSENDYKELLSQAKPKPENKTTVKADVKNETVKQAVKKAVLPKPEQKVAPSTKIGLEKITTKVWTQGKSQSATKTVVQNKAVSEIAKPAKVVTKQIGKPAVKPVTPRVIKSQPATKALVAQKPASIPVQPTHKPSVKQVQQVQQQPISAPVAESNIKPQTEQPAVTENVVMPPVQEQVVPPPSVAPPMPEPVQNDIVTQIKSVIKTNFYMICGLLASMFLILLIIARRVAKNHKKEKEFFTGQLQDKPLGVKDYTEIINDEDLNWKEKYQSFVGVADQKDEVNIPSLDSSESETSEIDELDQLFGEDEIFEETGIVSEINQEPESGPTLEAVADKGPTLDSYIDQFETTGSAEEIFASGDIDELFGDEEEPVKEEFYKEEQIPETTYENPFAQLEEPLEKLLEEPEEPTYIEEEDEYILSKYIIDDGKGFYLVNYEDTTALVGQIGDEIFVLKRFEERVDAPLKARLDEHKGDSANFMTRVGDYKALIQVTPKDMNLLIEL